MPITLTTDAAEMMRYAYCDACSGYHVPGECPVPDDSDGDEFAELRDVVIELDLKMPRLLYSVPDACSLLSVGRTTLYEHIRAGDLRTVRVGVRGIRIPATELAKFVADRLKEGP